MALKSMPARIAFPVRDAAMADAFCVVGKKWNTLKHNCRGSKRMKNEP
jgi:hypothetical protein